jgi:hypothetical protein
MASSDSIPAVFVNGFEITQYEDGSLKLILAEMDGEPASLRGCYAMPLSAVINLANLLNVHLAEMELEDPDTVVN